MEIDSLWAQLGEKYEEILAYFSEDKIRVAIAAVVLLLLIFFAYLSLTPGGTKMTVTDEQGRPLGQTTVELFDSNGNRVGVGQTDSSGTVSFPGTDPSSVKLYKASKKGFQDKQGPFDPSNPPDIRLDDPVTLPPDDSLNFKRPDRAPSLPDLNSPIPIDDPRRTSPNPINDNPPSVPDDSRPGSPGRAADATLEVTVSDSVNNRAIPNASVQLRNGATGMLLGSGATNAQGVIESRLYQGTSVGVQVQADGYAASETREIPIDSALVRTTIRLTPGSSPNTAWTNITILDAQNRALSDVRVQVFRTSQIVDQLTAADGSIRILLENGPTYTLMASKPGYSDATAQFDAGDSAIVTLRESPAATSFVTVSVQYTDARPVAGAGVTLFKVVNGVALDYRSQTADASGNARFDGVQRMNYRIVASAPNSRASTQLDVVVNAQDQSFQLSLTRDPVPTPSPGVSPTPTPTRGIGSSPTPSTGVSPTPDPQTFPGSSHPLCVGQSVILRPSAGAKQVRYTFRDFTYSSATFLVEMSSAGGPFTSYCPAYSPDCTYGLGAISRENEALSRTTGVSVHLASIDPQTRCISLVQQGESQCLGTGCPCPLGGNSVCGFNGVSYANSCGADRVPTGYVSGLCSSSCLTQYDPVCGANRRTYTNICEARRANALPGVAGECPVPPRNLTLNLPAGWSSVAPFNIGKLIENTCHYAESARNLIFSYFGDAGYYESIPAEPLADLGRRMLLPKGYLVKSDVACRMTFENQPVTQGYDVILFPGWNLIAGPPQAKTFNEIRGTCPENLGVAVPPFPPSNLNNDSISDYVYPWPGTVIYQPFVGASAGVQDSTPLLASDGFMEPGRGYWVLVNPGLSNCTLKVTLQAVTPTATPQPSIVPTPTPTVAPTASPAPSISPTPGPTATPTPSASPTPIATPTASPTPTPLPSPSPTEEPPPVAP